jgi:hypothetical protein
MLLLMSLITSVVTEKDCCVDLQSVDMKLSYKQLFLHMQILKLSNL